ncbi:TPA: phage portal protein [Klebsiella quasipneumoniae subsp. similipneumoniae]
MARKRNYKFNTKPVTPKARKYHYSTNQKMTRGIPEGDYAAYNLFNNGIYMDTTDINKVINGFLRPFRMSSRNLKMTNGIFSNYVTVSVREVIGSDGIYIRPMVNMFDDMEKNIELSQELEKRFYKWATDANQFSVQGNMDIVTMQHLMEETRAVDGESWLHVESVNGVLKVEMIDSARVPTTNNNMLAGSRYISNGIEFDKNGKPIAVYVMRYNPIMYTYEMENFERIPFENMLHYFKPSWVNQQRGIPDVVNGVESLKNMQKFLDSSLSSKVLSTSLMGFITTPNTNDQYVNLNTEDISQYQHDYAPGAMIELQEGKDIKEFNPKLAVDGIKEYTSELYKTIAMSLNITPQALTGDVSDASFSRS